MKHFASLLEAYRGRDSFMVSRAPLELSLIFFIRKSSTNIYMVALGIDARPPNAERTQNVLIFVLA